MKNAIIIGATGFGGMGLIEILIRHPHIDIKQLVARKDTGMAISSVFPHLKGYCDIVVDSPENIDLEGVDIAFFSTPDRTGMKIIREFFDKKIPVIDFSGDFRFSNIKDYEVYAKNKGMDYEHLSPDILEYSVYGLPEKFTHEIKNAGVVGNPGCFAICILLALLPAIDNDLLSTKTIICDGKTGVSGAGKNSGEANLYPQRHENINTYREGSHQHVVEVENIINLKEKSRKNLLFIPQIVPINRGILINIYSDLKEDLSTDDLLELFSGYYRETPFVIISRESPNTAHVRGSNNCIIRPFVDARTGKLTITSVIDNLMKGQAGNAVQNANIMLGFDQTLSLKLPGFYP